MDDQSQKLVDKRSQGNERNNVGSDDQNETAGRQNPESPRNEKNGSLPSASIVPSATEADPPILAIKSSSCETCTGFNIEVTTNALITLTGIAVKIYWLAYKHR